MSKVRRVSAEGSASTFDKVEFPESHVVRASIVPTSIIRYAYYAFVFSLPLERADIDILGLPLAKMCGLILITVTIAVMLVSRRRSRFELPPKGFWCFASYAVVYLILGLDTILRFHEQPELSDMIITGMKTLVQLLVLVWISYNCMRYERTIRGTLLSLAASCALVALLSAFDITGSITTADRVAAFDTDPNGIAGVLSVGLIILIGLMYGREKTDSKTRLFLLLCCGGFGVAIVITGSRGGILAVTMALLVLFLSGKSLRVKLRSGIVAFLALGVLALASYKIEPVRERWARAYFEQDTSGRDKIFEAAWEMFLEKPITGWGPANHLFELGARLGLRNVRDTHNLFLFILTESGLIGIACFFAGVWFCWRAAWKARDGTQGALPLALLCLFLTLTLTLSKRDDKLFWLVLTYALASGGLDASAKLKNAIGSLGRLGLRPVQQGTTRQLQKF